jgi:phage FluMu protein Com
MDFTLIITGVRCEICNFVWIAGYRQDVKELQCPNCKQMTDINIVSLDALNNNDTK